MNSSAFGDDSHYYAQASAPKRKPGPKWDNPGERLMRQILMHRETDIQKRVERVCKNANLVVREYLRSETALKLSQGEHRQAVPVYVVDGVPDLLAEIISQAPDPVIWHLYNNREILDNIASELQFINKYLPNILRFFNWKESGEAQSLADTHAFVRKILHALDEFELPRLIWQVEEDILGSYYFRIPAIYIYWMPIAFIAGIIKVKIEDLTFVVLTHELAHAYTHLGADLGGAQWDTSAFAKASKYIVEGLAQFYTESICGKYVNRQPGVLDAFTTLLSRQSPIYTDYRNWIKDHPSEVIRFTMVSARLNRIVQYDAFKSVMNEIEKRIRNDPHSFSDESEIEIKQDKEPEIMPPDIKRELITSLRLRYDDIVDSYEYSLRGLIAVLEDPQYDNRQMIVRDSNGKILEFQLFYTSPPETWEVRCGRKCSYKVDPLTLKAELFGEIVMN